MNGIVKNLAKVTTIIVALVACACTATAIRTRPPLDHYTLLVNDDEEKRRFDITLTSYDSRPLCVSEESWPNSSGKFTSDNGDVFLKIDSVVLPARTKLLSAYCPGGCGEHSIRQGEPLQGYISYDAFGDAGKLTKDSKKTLIFKVFPYYCH